MILFPDQREAAFSINRFWCGLSYAVVLLATLFLSVKIQLWLTVFELLISILAYSIVVLKTSNKTQLLPCHAQKSFTSAENAEDA